MIAFNLFLIPQALATGIQVPLIRTILPQESKSTDWFTPSFNDYYPTRKVSENYT
jgi:hypothetical protein